MPVSARFADRDTARLTQESSRASGSPSINGCSSGQTSSTCSIPRSSTAASEAPPTPGSTRLPRPGLAQDPIRTPLRVLKEPACLAVRSAAPYVRALDIETQGILRNLVRSRRRIASPTRHRPADQQNPWPRWHLVDTGGTNTGHWMGTGRAGDCCTGPVGEIRSAQKRCASNRVRPVTLTSASRSSLPMDR